MVNHGKSMVNPYISYDLRPCKSQFSANFWSHPPHRPAQASPDRGPGARKIGRGDPKGDVYWFITHLIDHSTYIKLYKWTPPLYDIIQYIYIYWFIFFIGNAIQLYLPFKPQNSPSYLPTYLQRSFRGPHFVEMVGFPSTSMAMFTRGYVDYQCCFKIMFYNLFIYGFMIHYDL